MRPYVYLRLLRKTDQHASRVDGYETVPSITSSRRDKDRIQKRILSLPRRSIAEREIRK